MDSDQNLWQCWQADSDGPHWTDTGGNEEVLQSSTTLHYSEPDSACQTLGGESWQEPKHLLWSNSDSEDHRRNAEFSSPFLVELNGISHASSESCPKNFPVAGDGGVATAPGPENLGMCSRATQGPPPKRNHTTAAKIAQNLVPLRNQKKIDGVKKTGRRHRCPNWTLEENRSFLQHMEVEVQKGKSPWKAISNSLKAMDFTREEKACEDHWGVLRADLTKFEKHFGSDNILQDRHFWPSVGIMSREQKSQNGLPLVFEVEWFEAIARIENERSKNRKSRRENSKDRIHDAETPSSSSRRQLSRVSAASATPSCEIFDKPVGDGDEIRELVRLLGDTDRNVTVEQTIEITRISLEARKMDLRKQEMDLRKREIEWEKEQMYRGQRNGFSKKARRPPAGDEWN